MAVDDAFTKVLLHMDGTDASTTFTDDSGKAWGAAGGAQIDTAQSKFGSASGLFDGTGDYLATVNNTDYDMGTGAFTVDFWYRRNGNQTGISGLFSPQDSVSGWGVQFGNSAGSGTTNAPFLATRAGGASTVRVASATALTNTTWTHIAIVRNGDNVYIFQDGTQTATATGMVAVNFNSAGSGAVIGRRLTDSAEGLDINGWMDEFRISKGIARWTTNFTPPTSAYAPSGGLWLFF